MIKADTMRRVFIFLLLSLSAFFHRFEIGSMGIDAMAVISIRSPKKFAPIPMAHKTKKTKKIHDKVFAFFSFMIFLLKKVCATEVAHTEKCVTSIRYHTKSKYHFTTEMDKMKSALLP